MSYINVKLRSSTKTQTTPRPFLECRLARHVTQWQACRAARLGDICFHRLAALSDGDISIFLDSPAINVFKRSAGSKSRASLLLRWLERQHPAIVVRDKHVRPI